LLLPPPPPHPASASAIPDKAANSVPRKNPFMTESPLSNTVILPASLRNRLPSETRAAVCLILGPAFVLWQEGEPESSDQSISLL
jgi:hypothetical protein